MNDLELGGHGTTSETHEYSYTDIDVIAGKTYEYRLSDVSESNEITELATYTVMVDVSDHLTPETFGLVATYPNPFNPTLTICYNLTERAQTIINILNLRGQVMGTLENKVHSPGTYESIWNADAYPSGIYIVYLHSGELTDLQKVVLVK